MFSNASGCLTPLQQLQFLWCSLHMAFSLDMECLFLSGFMCVTNDICVVKHKKNTKPAVVSDVLLTAGKQCTVEDVISKELESEKAAGR